MRFFTITVVAIITMSTNFITSCRDDSDESLAKQEYDYCLDSCVSQKMSCENTCKAGDSNSLPLCLDDCKYKKSTCDIDCSDEYLGTVDDNSNSNNTNNTNNNSNTEEEEEDTDCIDDCGTATDTCEAKCPDVRITEGLYIKNRDCVSACFDNMMECMDGC